jgi:HEPN domain-containing protein
MSIFWYVCACLNAYCAGNRLSEGDYAWASMHAIVAVFSVAKAILEDRK